MAVYEHLTYTIGKTCLYPWGNEIPVVIMNKQGDVNVIILSVPSKMSVTGIAIEALRRVKLYHAKLSETKPIEIHADVQDVYDKLIEKGYLKKDETVDDMPAKV